MTDTKYHEAIWGALKNLDLPVRVIDKDGIVVYMNHHMKDIFGDLVGSKAGFIFDSEGQAPPGGFQYEEGFIGSLPHYREEISADVIYSVRTIEAGGGALALEILEDITARRSSEEQKSLSLAKVRRDVSLAREIQQSLLPGDGSYWGCIDLASKYLPAEEIGGDIYDIIRIGEGEALFYIADVSGHGIQASMLTMYIGERLREAADLSDRGLEWIMEWLLGRFCDLDIDSSIYITLLACIYRQKEHMLSLANAGHNCMPLIIRKGGLLEEVTMKGMPLSKISGPGSYKAEDVYVKPGDRVMLYTDGIVEEYSRAKKDVLGSDGLREAVEANKALGGRALTEKVIAKSDEYMILNAKDDRTVVVAEFL